MRNSQKEKEQCNELPIYSYMLVLWKVQLSHFLQPVRQSNNKLLT